MKRFLFLLLAAVIWGVAFVAQSVGMEYVGGFTFNGVRSLIGFVVLLPVIRLMERINGKEAAGSQTAGRKESRSSLLKEMCSDRTLLAGGACCGLILFAASNFQQFGIKYTSVGKAGFITACYIVLVPILGLFLKKPCGFLVWLAVILAAAGLYFLCMKEHLSLGSGDLLVLSGSVLFALHILAIDHFSPMTDGVKLSCLQFLTAGFLSLVLAFVFENPSFSQIFAAWLPILYAGVMSCGVAYTLQILGQKGTNPTVASLILSLESVVSVLAGWLILGQSLSQRELFGCVMVFAAILLAQMPGRKDESGKVVSGIGKGA